MRKLSLLILFAFLPQSITVAAPQITNLSVRGLQIGGTTRIVVTGKELLPNPRVVLPFPVRQQKVVGQANPERVVLDVQLAKATPVGFFQFRLASDSGISNPIPIGVDRLHQLPFVPEVEHLPVALNGVLAGSRMLEVSFTAKKGTQLVAEVESKRLGGKLNPVVRILDSQKRQLSFGGPQARLRGDARAVATLPLTGKYTIVLHDRLYRGAAPGNFRLKIGSFKFADLAYPSSVARNRKTSLHLLSSNLPNRSAIVFDPKVAALRQHAPLTLPASLSGAGPVLTVTDFPVVGEAPQSAQQAKIKGAPVTICGRIMNRGEEDKFRVPVQPGQKLRVTVIAQQLGSPLDGVLTLRDSSGRQLATNDDRSNTADPELNYNVAAGIKAIDVCLKDLSGGSGSDYIYQIHVDDLGRPDFQLALTSDRVNVPTNGNQVIRVQANRRAFNGEIQLSVQGLPPGVQLQGGKIRAGQNVGLLTVSARQSQPMHWLARVTGSAKIGNRIVQRIARINADATTSHLHYLRDDTGLSITKPAPVSVSWSGPRVMVRGTTMTRSVKLGRTKDATGRIRLRLMTNQTIPRRTVRRGKKNVQINDDDRTVRLVGQTIVMPGKNLASVNVAVPTDASSTPYSLVLLADLLAKDNKTVLSTVAAQEVSLGSKDPFQLQVSGGSVAALAGKGKAPVMKGKLLRSPGFTGEIVISLAGLPKGVKSPTVKIAGNRRSFELPLRFAASTKQTEFKNVTLVASYTPNAKRADLVIRKSGRKKLNIKVTRAKKPAKKSTKKKSSKKK